MGFLLLSAGKDLRRRLKDPASLLLWVGIPVMIGSLMSLVSGGGSMPKAKVLLVDQDDSFLSQLLAGAGGGSTESPIDIEVVELEEGQQRMDDGEASALLILPEGFGEAVLKEEPTTLTLVTNPAQRILPGIVQEGLEILIEASFYTQRLVGEELREMATGPPEGENFFASEVVARMGIDINERMRGLEDYLFPAVLLVEAEPAEEGAEADEPEPSIGTFMLPMMLMMSLLFIAQGMSEDIWKEKLQGTLRRVCSSPQGMAAFLGGKILAGAVIVAGVCAVGIAIGCVAFDMNVTLSPLALLWCGFTGAAMLSFFVLVQTFTTTQRAGNILSTVLLFPLMMIGGSFFPFEAMPLWMREIGEWTPNGQALVRLKDLLRGDLPLLPLLIAAVAIGAPALIAFLISARRMRGRFLLG